jgi:hypothetical protein
MPKDGTFGTEPEQLIRGRLAPARPGGSLALAAQNHKNNQGTRNASLRRRGRSKPVYCWTPMTR